MSLKEKIVWIGKRESHARAQLREFGLGVLFILPNAVVFTAFLLIPVLFTFYISAFEWSILGGRGEFVGLDNYRSLMDPMPWEDSWAPVRSPGINLWWWAVSRTAIFTFGVVPMVIFGGLAVALLIDSDIRGGTFWRTAYFIPVMLAGAISAVIWRWILDWQGILNEFLRPVGLAHPWVGNTTTALPSVMLVAIWAGIGFNMIIYLAGLQNIPDALYDAAHIDGANQWQRFRHVTWPSLNNITFFVIVLAIISSFQVFAFAFVMTRGGPHFATTTIVVLIYNRAFQGGQMGLAAAMSIFLFFIIFMFSYWQYRMRDTGEVVA